jgi:hypothetical protein
MRQQIFEDALKSIVHVIASKGSTMTHDTHTDRRRANAALAEIAKIANEALDRKSDPEGMRSPSIGGNSGHGHVWARPDGVRARCGGPALCAECAKDAARLKARRETGNGDV